METDQGAEWVAGLARDWIGCPLHIFPLSDLDENDLVAVWNLVYLIFDFYISDL